MIIVLKIDDFLSKLFSSALEKRNNIPALRQELIDYYTFGPFRPQVDIEGDFIRIEIYTSSITAQKADFDAVVKHCEAGRFNKAKPIRFADLKVIAPNINYPLFIVAPSAKKNRVFDQLKRPSFKKLGLDREVRYLSYEAIEEVDKFFESSTSGLNVDLIVGKSEAVR